MNQRNQENEPDHQLKNLISNKGQQSTQAQYFQQAIRAPGHDGGYPASHERSIVLKSDENSGYNNQFQQGDSRQLHGRGGYSAQSNGTA
ncbi:hypothetical protein K3495_g11027 [Podosphaera aphanis]|nr:hypothetical protein K3495_g11027 [Podosphaera aphanis]